MGNDDNGRGRGGKPVRQVKDYQDKSGCAPKIIFMIALCLGVGAAHYFFDVLDPVINAFKNRPKNGDPRVEQPGTVQVGQVPENTEQPLTVVEQSPLPKPVVKVPERELTTREQAEKGFRERFQAPRIGSLISLVLKNGRPFEGKITLLTDTQLELYQGKSSMIINKSRLSGKSLAMCYENEYVTYMMAKYEQYMAQRGREDRRVADYKQKQSESTAAAKARRERAEQKKTYNSSSSSRNSSSWAQFMEDNGQADLLEERRKRMKAYEKRAAASGQAF